MTPSNNSKAHLKDDDQGTLDLLAIRSGTHGYRDEKSKSIWWDTSQNDRDARVAEPCR